MNMKVNMNLDIKNITPKLLSALDKLKEYAVFIVVLVVLGAYGFLVLRIRYFASQEPADAVLTEKVNELNAPRIDKDIITKIEKLESSNIEVKTLFDKARDNPFQE